MDPATITIIAAMVVNAVPAAINYFRKEAAILELLKEHVNSQGKSLEVHVRLSKDIEVDAVAFLGVDDLSGPTIFEVKKNIDSQKELKDLLDSLDNAASLIDAKNIVIIVIEDSTQSQEKIVKSLTKHYTSRVPFQIWTVNSKIQEMAKRFTGKSQQTTIPPAQTSEPKPNVPIEPKAEVTEEKIDNSAELWKSSRTRFVSELSTAYRNNDLVLFLGAGVSIEAGVPTWNALLKTLLMDLVSIKAGSGRELEDIEQTVAYLQSQHGMSPLLLARYIRAGLGSEFANKLADALYRDLRLPLSEHARLLNSIARLCRPRRGGSSVRAVVTYNFDDLLETRLAEMAIDHISIYRESDVAKEQELGVCHVHGFIPRDHRKNELADSVLVFSEEGYHTVFMDPYSWSNIVQLNYLRQSTCLLIGLSAQDPNLRRLAEFIARKIRISKHFVILRREKPNGALSSEAKRLYDKISHELQEEALRELGFNVLWVESYDEIPEIIESIERVRT